MGHSRLIDGDCSPSLAPPPSKPMLRRMESSLEESMRRESRDKFDCFPMPVQLTCWSPRKKRNELRPAFSAVLEQDITLYRGGKYLHLVLLGAHLDSQDESKLIQLEAVERLLRARRRQEPFCGIIWGSLNSRLVAFEELNKHLVPGNETDSEHAYKLSDSGVDLLLDMIDDPERRRELLLKDALVYSGKDANGKDYPTLDAERCSHMMSELFDLHLDYAADRRLEVPLPSYKQTLLDQVLTNRFGCRVRLEEVALMDQVRKVTFTAGRAMSDSSGNSRASCDTADSGDSWPHPNLPMTRRHSLNVELQDLKRRYFGWDDASGSNAQRSIKPDVGKDGTDMYLQLGWLDGVGIFKKDICAAEATIRVWETEEKILVFDHVPLRSVVEI